MIVWFAVSLKQCLLIVHHTIYIVAVVDHWEHLGLHDGDDACEYWSMPEDVLLSVTPEDGSILLQTMQQVAKEWNKRNKQV